MPKLSDDDLPSFTDFLTDKLGGVHSASQDPWLVSIKAYLDEVGRRVNALSKAQKAAGSP